MFWILICIIISLLIANEIIFRWKYRSLNRFPEPIYIPFAGSIIYFLYFKRLLQTLNYLTKNFGSIIKFQAGHEMILIVSDPNMLQFFLHSPKFVDKSDLYHYGAPWLGKNGIFISERIQWHKYRKLYTPIVYFSSLEEYVKIINSHCAGVIGILSKLGDSSPVDIHPIVSNFVFDFATEVILAFKTKYQRKTEYMQAMHFLEHSVLDRYLSLWKRFDFLYKLSPHYKLREKYLKVIFETAEKAIENRRKILSEKKTDKMELSDTYSDGSKKNILFIDLLLNGTIDGKPIPEDIIKTEINSGVFVVHGTSTSAISIMMYTLASYKEVQNKVVKELKYIYGDDRSRPATMEDLSRMKYMELVIKETLRLYTMAPFIGRKLKEDVDYKGTIIPEGTNLLINLYGLHRSSVFDKPEEFIPERFLSTNYIKPYTFIPFSAGPRNCLGQKIAILSLKIAFSQFLRHFEFESAGPDYKMDLEPQTIMEPLSGIYIKIKPRVF